MKNKDDLMGVVVIVFFLSIGLYIGYMGGDLVVYFARHIGYPVWKAVTLYLAICIFIISASLMGNK